MTYFHPAWLEHQRKRFTRADAYRLAAPGTPEAKMPGWLDPSMLRVRLKEAQQEEARQDAARREALARSIEQARRDLDDLKREIAEKRAAEARADEAARIKCDIGFDRFVRTFNRYVEQQKAFNASQPRVPAGNPDGGQWTSGANSAGNASVADGQIRSDVGPDPTRPGAQYAQNEPRRPIDLLEEQRLGGHAIEGHVGKSQQFLLNRARQLALSAERKGDFVDGIRVGSFSSLEAANRLVNGTIAQNPAKIERVTSGQSPREELTGSFDSITGYEAYARTERSQPYIRDTDGVVVVIVRDRQAEKGYRVDSAFPVRFGR
jgi:hypothetical protein